MSEPADTFMVKINEAGELVFVYADELAELLGLGEHWVARASHVEPICTTPSGCLWKADLAPVNGPRLGPFSSRGAALAAEREWLEANCV